MYILLSLTHIDILSLLASLVQNCVIRDSGTLWEHLAKSLRINAHNLGNEEKVEVLLRSAQLWLHTTASEASCLGREYCENIVEIEIKVLTYLMANYFEHFVP